MLRDPDGKYKFGRSTMREQGLIKIKRVHDDEAKITGFEELMINSNEAEVNALGLQERSTKKSGLVPGGTLGALICQHKNGKPFKIGTGYDEATRRRLWKRRYYLSGKYVKYKYQELTPDGIPRFPVYKGLPAEEELEDIHPTTTEDQV
jgi:DNA ligase-1